MTNDAPTHPRLPLRSTSRLVRWCGVLYALVTLMVGAASIGALVDAATPSTSPSPNGEPLAIGIALALFTCSFGASTVTTLIADHRARQHPGTLEVDADGWLVCDVPALLHAPLRIHRSWVSHVRWGGADAALEVGPPSNPLTIELVRPMAVGARMVFRLPKLGSEHPLPWRAVYSIGVQPEDGHEAAAALRTWLAVDAAAPAGAEPPAVPRASLVLRILNHALWVVPAVTTVAALVAGRSG